MSRNLLFVPLLLAAGLVLAEDVPEAERTAPSEAQAQTEAATPETETQPEAQTEATKDKDEDGDKDPKLLDGMSILGNQEAPKALVIVPWKTSELGAAIGIAPLLDDSRQPVDRDVFLRALSYYEIRSETTRHDGAPATSDAAQPANAARRSKS